MHAAPGAGPRPVTDPAHADPAQGDPAPTWGAEFAAEADRAARQYWEAEADAYQREHGAFLTDPVSAQMGASAQMGRTAPVGETSGGGFVWGPEGLTEAEAHVLGPLEALVGGRVLEVGCGAAQCSIWLARRGIQAFGVDISLQQLRHARDTRASSSSTSPTTAAATIGATGPPADAGPALVVATARALPFAPASFAAAFSAYGAVQFVADLDLLLAEVVRVLVPGGRWAFSVTHPVRWAFPDDPGPAGLAVSGSYFDRTPYVERAATDGRAVYAEFHRTLADYVAALSRAGLVVDTILEPEWPDWNDLTWGGWSPERGAHLPGTLIIGCRAGRPR